MKPRNRFLKLVAFVPAIAVVGAFIGCRTGAFERFHKTEPPVPSTQQPVSPPPQPPASETKPVFMGGSKSPNLPSVTTGLTPVKSPIPATPNAPAP